MSDKMREEIARAIRNALVENWSCYETASKWNEDVLLTGCKKVGNGMGYQNPEQAAQNLALDAADAVLALPLLSSVKKDDVTSASLVRARTDSTPSQSRGDSASASGMIGAKLDHCRHLLRLYEQDVREEANDKTMTKEEKAFAIGRVEELKSEIATLEARLQGLEPLHASDCAVHREPAFPAGPCNCGASEASRYVAPPDVSAIITELVADQYSGELCEEVCDLMEQAVDEMIARGVLCVRDRSGSAGETRSGSIRQDESPSDAQNQSPTQGKGEGQ